MKETYYFSHDYTARNDEKIKKLLRKFGATGYGIYWMIIEDLYQHTNVLRTDYEGIGYDLRVNADTVKSIINDFGLFTVNEDTFSSDSIQRRINERKEKSLKARESISKRWKKYDRNTNVLQDEYDSNTIKERKGKERKGEERKGDEVQDVVISNPYESTTSTATKRIFATQSDTYEQQAKEDQSLIELISMQNKIKPERTKELIAEFFQLKRVIDHSWSNYSDLKSNILNWMPKKLNAKTPINETAKKPAGRVI